MTTKNDYTIDAAGKKLGRIASQAAKALMGKVSVAYTPNVDTGTHVVITNASKLYLSERKRQSKIYQTYSGHPGGLKEETMQSLIGRKGHEELLRRAVERMLPRNATRKARMKRLKISK